MDALIEVKELTKTYEIGTVKVEALRGLDLVIRKNEYVAIMGPSGSGKSTLMNIIGCLDTPTGGSYRLHDINVEDMNDNELAMTRNREIGFVFQTFNLLPRANAYHNVELPLIYNGTPARERKIRTEESLSNVGLGDRIYHKPSELSGGQRQRVAIARALVNKPAIILADEPTGNLDSTTGEEIMDIFRKIHSKGNTIILVTHEEYIADHANRIIRLKDGMISGEEWRNGASADNPASRRGEG